MMQDYLKRARAELLAFDSTATKFLEALETNPNSFKLPQPKIQDVRTVLADLPVKSKIIQLALEISEKTAFDIADRLDSLKGQSRKLALRLKDLSEVLKDELREEPGNSPSEALAERLEALDAAAKRVAMALFPNALEGLREVNTELFKFRQIENDYNRVLGEQKGRLTPEQLAEVEKTAATLRARFDAVNDLVNELVISRVGGSDEVKALVQRVSVELADAIREAGKHTEEALKPFRGVFADAKDLAVRLGRFKVRVPIFPGGSSLAEIAGLIDPALYDELSGVQRMALFNIISRLKSITFGTAPGEDLLAAKFNIKIIEVFTDRIYLEVDKPFIDTIAGFAQKGAFEKAPASLHKFRDGSFKQKVASEGNLQVCFAAIPNSNPSRLKVDADIDLYRSPLRHLFGEVLVNHLTGTTTDQFKVFDILAATKLPMVAGFALTSLGLPLS
jgi:hypothetical protein